MKMRLQPKNMLVFMTIGLIPALIVNVIDPSVYLSYHTPKNFLLIVLTAALIVAFGLSVWLGRIRFISLTWIEILLFGRILWLTVCNPSMITRPADNELWILISLAAFSFFVRQAARYDKSDVTEAGDNKWITIIFFRSIWISGIIQAFVGIYQLIRYTGDAGLSIKTPVMGTIGSSNGYGLFMALSFIAAVADWRVGHKRWMIPFVPFIAVLDITMLLISLSRGAMISLIIAGAIVFYISPFFNSKHRAKTAIFIIFCLFFLPIIFFGLFRMDRESAIGRFMVWRISAPMLTRHSCTGIGQGRYAVEYLNYQAEFFMNSDHMNIAYKAANLKQAHNEFLQSFCEGGIIGGLLFMTIWAAAVRSLVMSRAKQGVARLALIAMLMSILIHSLFDTPLHVLPISIIAYVVLGLIPSDRIGSFKITIHKTWIKRIVGVSSVLTSSLILCQIIPSYQGYRDWQSGRVLMEHRYIGGAIEIYRKALRLVPDKGELQFHLGSALVLDGQYSKGIYYLGKSLHSFNDRNIYLSMSYGYTRLGDLTRAEAFAKQASDCFPDHLAPYLLLGEIYHSAGRLEESKTCLMRCIRQETRILSEDTEKIRRDALQLWQLYYQD